MIRLLSVLMMLCLFGAIPQARAMDMQNFGRLPVLHEGRVKPLESFAAAELDRFSAGRSYLKPEAWLAQILFAPDQAISVPVFSITHPDLLARLDLQKRRGLFSLQEITPALERTHDLAFALSDQEKLTAEQQALVRLHENALAYGQLLQAMTPFLPMTISPPASLKIEDGIYGAFPSYIELRRYEPALLEMVKRTVAQKGDNPEVYSDEEKAAAFLSMHMSLLGEAGFKNVLLRVIPPQWAGSDDWLSPWALLLTGQGGPQSAELLNIWQLAAKAYREGDDTAWQEQTAHLYETAVMQSKDSALASKLEAEIAYNIFRPFRLAMIAYAASFLLAALFITFQKSGFYRAIWVSAFAGVICHATGIGLRIIILERPPVGSLYESLLFVTLVVMVIGLVTEFIRRDGLSVIGGAICAWFILFIAPVTAPEGDNLQQLVAVLNTNFWLATHVLCITAGYGVCLLTAMLAHIALFFRGLHPQDRKERLFRMIYILSLLALLLTAVGTVLGGIWADQSWGRFWGWDPKENGALLIVLWLIWLHHGKIAGKLGQRGFLSGLALLNIVVGLAWFGVNLLSVGLHSYGFTSGTAIGLAVFSALEVAGVATLYILARRKALP